MTFWRIVAESKECRYEGSIRAFDEAEARVSFRAQHPAVENFISVEAITADDFVAGYKAEAKGMVDRELLEAIYVMLRAR